jgi:hypothetical protein
MAAWMTLWPRLLPVLLEMGALTTRLFPAGRLKILSGEGLRAMARCLFHIKPSRESRAQLPRNAQARKPVSEF